MSHCTYSSVQYLKVDGVTLYCCLQCTVVLVGVVLKGLLGGTMMWQCDHVVWP